MGFVSPKSPNFWVFVASILAMAGLTTSTIGWMVHIPWLRIAGIVLLAPLLIGGIGLILIVIPILILANHKKR